MQSVEELIKKVTMMPRIQFFDMKVFKDEMSEIDITTLLDVQLTHESILIYSRYVKRSRKLS